MLGNGRADRWFADTSDGRLPHIGQDTEARSRRAENTMKLTTRIILVVLAIAVVGGGAFLAVWEIPAPAASVEKVIPNDRVFR
jgi:hypothetical protein